MIKMRPYAPSDRIAIRADSIDEELSDEIEDDVFIRDSRSAKINEEKGLKRPLMAPRRYIVNGKIKNPIPIMKKNRRRVWKCCEPFCYGLAALAILIVLIFLAALILTLFPIPLQKLKVWLKKDPPLQQLQVQQQIAGNSNVLLGISINNDVHEPDINGVKLEFIPCTQIQVHKVWTKIFSRYNSESPVRNADLNGDGIDDIIFGYGIDESLQYEGFPVPKCSTTGLLEETVPCEGGVIALNGISGNLLWQFWTAANIFSVLCATDINKDGYMDCIIAGRGGLIIAINGRNGEMIWNLQESKIETNLPIIIDLYTINSIRDLDNDGCPDIIAVHLEERKSSRIGHIKLVSGKTGKIIRSLPTPFKEEVFVPIQLITEEDGTELLLIITGGQNSPGGIYTLRLDKLMEYHSEKEFIPIFQTDFSGIMAPAILTDITSDGVDDIIVSSFNSTVYAFDGRNYSMLWNYTFPASESVSAIVPGHFNHDNVTDFMVKYNTGPGFPVYYYSQTQILNGINGQPLLKSTMTDSGGPNNLLGGSTISQTFGGDFFLHWQVQCRDKLDAKDAYEFIPDSDIILQARADVCVLRYNTTTVLKLYAIARHVEPPGAVIFNSDDLEVHLNRTNLQQLNRNQNSVSPIKHPKLYKNLQFKANKVNLPPDTPIIDEKNILTENLQMRKQFKKFKNRLGELSGLDDVRRTKYRKPLYNKKILKLPPGSVEDELENSRTQYIDPLLKSPFVYSPYNDIPPERDFKDYENEKTIPVQQEEYDVLYNDEQSQQMQQQINERPIRLRTKYPGNRDVRSENEGTLDSFELQRNDSIVNHLMEQNLSEENTTNALPLNLWDLEMEKEEEEALKESQKLNDQRKRREGVTKPIVVSPQSPSTTTETSFNNNNNDLFLTSISSTGVLLPSLDKTTNSSIDFTFVVNVRESETYPPLLLPEDLTCAEEKINAYKNYNRENFATLQKEIIDQCLKLRLKNITRNLPRYESQIVITRISISCTCGILQPGEICSKLNSIDKQKWTQFMGKSGNGVY